MNLFARIAALALFLPTVALAADYTDKKSAEWSPEEVDKILKKSPWTIEVNVFPAVLKSPDEAAQKPSANIRVAVNVAWTSAGIYRNARTRLFKDLTPEQAEEMTRPSDRFYIVSVEAPETLSVLDSIPEADLIANTSLEVDGKKYPLAIFQRPSELKAPLANFFFERGTGIPADAKTAVFKTKAREFSAEAKFKFEKMTWQGKRDLDGELAEPSAAEKRRREVQAAVLGTEENPGFFRSVSDVKVEKRGDKSRPWAAYVFYDSTRETPAEGKTVDAIGRKREMASRVGTWSLANGSSLEVIVFVNARTNKAEDYILGPEAEKVSKMAPEGAAAAFKDKLVSADKPKTAPKDDGKKKDEKKPK